MGLDSELTMPCTVKGFNFAVLKVRGFLDGTFRGGFNFADYSIASYIYQQITIDRSVKNDRGGFNFAEKLSTANIAKLKPPRIFALLQYAPSHYKMDFNVSYSRI